MWNLRDLANEFFFGGLWNGNGEKWKADEGEVVRSLLHFKKMIEALRERCGPMLALAICQKWFIVR